MEKVEIVLNSLPMSGGDGPNSYSKNSHLQRKTTSLLKETIDKLILEKLDAKTLISGSNTFRIADLGCATGPNTFFLVDDIIKSVETSLRKSNSSKPEFLVYFNDLPENDFNTLFTSLPQDTSYLAVGVPGSFYGRVIPRSSVHIVVTVGATHWLSSVPKEVLDKRSKAWNKGKVHYSNAAKEVVKAYERQFGRDMGKFLEVRAKELVSGGLLVVGMCGIPKGMPFSNLADSVMYTSMAEVLIQMQSQGLITEEQADTFNIPIYSASPEEVTFLVETNGCFTVESMELMNPAAWLKRAVNVEDVRQWMICIKATMGSLFINHFGDHILDVFFDRLTEKLVGLTEKIESSYREKLMLFFALKRK
ncbi:PREDICTED: probable S-adenosylmethionine-dependent methyltransferase At5g38780 [Camelina sativa]|uniref:Probable S-adenosylmethionine-dependent methyltransferase At5g38780 n=1 Tax=Camelina sativa TaxID=90675 RepID=A0ABM0SS94_CAMSA|nr:PREDICTED: probable S-adenosylmethionine-dependent methyltransferase At5g38780 [Camelina sativa]